MSLLLVEVIDIINISLVSIAVILIVVSFFVKAKQSDTGGLIKEQEKSFELLAKEQAREFENIKEWFKVYAEGQKELIKSYNERVESDISKITIMQKNQLEITHQELVKLKNSNEQKLDKMQELVNNNLDRMLKNNEIKLEQMRKTVGEKLDETLDNRFKQSFNIMNEQFKTMTDQLNKMSTIANSVGDLQKILTNVKTRGTFGEVQLGNLLEQMLAPNQYASQVSVKKGDQRGGVDFVIYLPGKDDENTLLPVDAKFPVEDYLRLVEASERGDTEAVRKFRVEIAKSIKKEAKSINQKYINPPLTTPFAILYIATEGMYSELLQNSGLIEQLQQEHKVIISGPTTFSAMLSSLQMGFKTLSIQKHSAEIWTALSSFKKDFSLFTDLLVKTGKKVNEVSNTIENATKRTQIIGKKLNKVTEIAAPNEKIDLTKSLADADSGEDED